MKSFFNGEGIDPAGIAKNLDAVKYTPWVGDLAYKNLGRGKTLREEKARTQGSDKTDLQKIEEAILGSGSHRR